MTLMITSFIYHCITIARITHSLNNFNIHTFITIHTRTCHVTWPCVIANSFIISYIAANYYIIMRTYLYYCISLCDIHSSCVCDACMTAISSVIIIIIAIIINQPTNQLIVYQRSSEAINQLIV